MLALLDPFVLPLHAALVALTGPLGAAPAIVALTLLLRLLLHPLVRHAHLAAIERRPGCLPVLVQLPFLLAIYRIFTSPVVAGQTNGLLQHSLLGAPLGVHLLEGGLTVVPVFAVLAVLMLLVCWLSYRFARAHAVAPALPDGTSPEMAEAMARTQRLLPYLSFGSLVGVLVMPLAGGIYLLTSVASALAERAWLRHRHPMPAAG